MLCQGKPIVACQRGCHAFSSWRAKSQAASQPISPPLHKSVRRHLRSKGAVKLLCIEAVHADDSWMETGPPSVRSRLTRVEGFPAARRVPA